MWRLPWGDRSVGVAEEVEHELNNFTSQQDRRLHLNVGLVTAGAGHRSHRFHFVVSPERSLLEVELRRELQVGDDEIAGGDKPPFCWRKAFQHGQRLLHRRENGNSRVLFSQHSDHSLCIVSRIESHV